ncbi:unnamed protein product, partial [Ectocarpus sp. 13 AM-2016]
TNITRVVCSETHVTGEKLGRTALKNITRATPPCGSPSRHALGLSCFLDPPHRNAPMALGYAIVTLWPRSLCVVSSLKERSIFSPFSGENPPRFWARCVYFAGRHNTKSKSLGSGDIQFVSEVPRRICSSMCQPG